MAPLLGFSACTTPTPGTTAATPEAQIKNGADASKAAATLAGVLVERNVITVAQAKGFSAALHGAEATLNQANVILVDCRTKTGSKETTVPDPCAFSIKDLIPLAIASINVVQDALAAKQ